MNEKFSKSVKNFIDKTNKRLNYIFSDVCKSLSKKIAMRTPVKTGRCLASWSPSINQISVMKHSGFDFKSEADRERNKEKALKVVIPIIDGKCSSLKLTDTYYFCNPWNYSVLLEYGHSRFAPNGMVRITMEESDIYIKNAVAKAKLEYK